MPDKGRMVRKGHLMKRLKNYEHTIYASYLGYITQAIVNNFAPLLFLTFARDFDLTLDKITFITTLNFAVQLTVDLLATKFVDKIGYRPCVLAAHIFSFLGLTAMAFLPDLVGNSYIGLIVSVVLYAIGGGIIEVLISPIVEACPTEKKEGAMSLLHSFYCWGHVAVVILSTVFFRFVGIGNWRILACLWAAIPLCNTLYFAIVPLYSIVSEEKKVPLTQLLKQKTFWLLMIIMICAGASEQAMSQWASAFAESGLQVSKTVGDLAGPCAFAILMGTSRAIYGKYSDKISLNKMVIGSSLLCVVCYLVASLSNNPVVGLIGCAACGFTVGIFWPGTFSTAAVALPNAGTAMYALMALAGDVGCSAGPSVVGFIANANGNNLKLGLFFAIAFPVLILIGYSYLSVMRKKQSV